MSKRRQNDVYNFYVAGKGSFPVDMLRYDGCYPVSSEDASKILIHGTDDDYFQIRQVKLRATLEHGRITPDRWASFGWHVCRTENESGRVLTQTPLYTESKRWGVG